MSVPAGSGAAAAGMIRWCSWMERVRVGMPRTRSERAVRKRRKDIVWVWRRKWKLRIERGNGDRRELDPGWVSLMDLV